MYDKQCGKWTTSRAAKFQRASKDIFYWVMISGWTCACVRCPSFRHGYMKRLKLILCHMTRSTETHHYGRLQSEDSEGGNRNEGFTLTAHYIFRGEQTGTTTWGGTATELSNTKLSFLVLLLYLLHLHNHTAPVSRLHLMRNVNCWSAIVFSGKHSKLSLVKKTPHVFYNK